MRFIELERLSFEIALLDRSGSPLDLIVVRNTVNLVSDRLPSVVACHFLAGFVLIHPSILLLAVWLVCSEPTRNV